MKIRFLGVWDTVGALGIPSFLASNIFDQEERYTFHDTELGSNVTTARHALAIDEKRENFLPTLWSNLTDHDDAKEIWFAGVHGDLGGSYAQRGLADISLNWMRAEIEAAGFRFKDGLPDNEDALAETNTSYEGFWRLLPTRPRGVPDLEGSPSLHPSVPARRAARPDYWATRSLDVGETVNVAVQAKEKWNSTGVYMHEGQQFDFSASGTWQDNSIPCGPDGTDDGEFHRGELLHVAAVPLDWLGRLLTRADGGENVTLPGTRRHPDQSWFRLMGAIAHNNVEDDGLMNAEPHETFVIGSSAPHTAEHSGYFYAYANDAWRFYGQNSGLVTLTITRTG